MLQNSSWIHRRLLRLRPTASKKHARMEGRTEERESQQEVAREVNESIERSQTVPDLDPNQYVNRTLSAPDKVIESVVLTQGGNEGSLARICVRV